ncbi:VOC family protein [Oceaniglobus roseus]|uniref:VOC family protein n=1 Tax=Oceaniglobus roseus TaxID=1737570 RepID=UPI000C7EB1CB|nr:VOC family protein [Kandeliimicrobium roseum]
MAAPGVEGVLEAAVYAADLDAAEAFYGGTLGLERIQRVDGRHVFFRTGHSVVLVFDPDETDQPPRNPKIPVPPHGARGPGHLCLNVAEAAMDAWRARLEAEGVEIEQDFLWPNGVRSIYVRDPAGNSVEFSSTRLWFGEDR